MIGTEQDHDQFMEAQRVSKPHHIQYGNKVEMWKRLQIADDQAIAKLREIGRLEPMIAQEQHDLDGYKNRHMLAIGLEVDSGNVKKWSNKTLRDGELARRLKDNPEYCEIGKRMAQTIDQLNEAKVDLEIAQITQRTLLMGLKL